MQVEICDRGQFVTHHDDARAAVAGRSVSGIAVSASATTTACIHCAVGSIAWAT